MLKNLILRHAILCSVLSVHLTSSKSLVGITGVVSEIQKEKKVRCLFLGKHIVSKLELFVLVC